MNFMFTVFTIICRAVEYRFMKRPRMPYCVRWEKSLGSKHASFARFGWIKHSFRRMWAGNSFMSCVFIICLTSRIPTCFREEKAFLGLSNITPTALHGFPLMRWSGNICIHCLSKRKSVTCLKVWKWIQNLNKKQRSVAYGNRSLCFILDFSILLNPRQYENQLRDFAP